MLFLSNRSVSIVREHAISASNCASIKEGEGLLIPSRTLEFRDWRFWGALIRTSTVADRSLTWDAILSALDLSRYFERAPALCLLPEHLRPRRKDFVDKTVRGLLGGAVASLYLERCGYAWSAHFENLVDSTYHKPDPCMKRRSNQPDWVYSNGEENCILEAKGSFKLESMWTETKSGFRNQIQPWIGGSMSKTVPGAEVARGVSVGAYFGVDGTEVHAIHSPSLPGYPTVRRFGRVQQLHYARMLGLLGLVREGRALQAGESLHLSVPLISMYVRGTPYVTTLEAVMNRGGPFFMMRKVIAGTLFRKIEKPATEELLYPGETLPRTDDELDGEGLSNYSDGFSLLYGETPTEVRLEQWSNGKFVDA